MYEQSKTKVSFGIVVVGMSLASAKMVLSLCVCMCTHVYAWIDVPVCKQIEAKGWYCVSSGISTLLS